LSPTEESTAAQGAISCAANMKTSNLRWLVGGRDGPVLARMDSCFRYLTLAARSAVSDRPKRQWNRTRRTEAIP